MKRLVIVFLLLGYFSSGAQAVDPVETKYIGVFYAEADSGEGDTENGNLGLVIGGHVESGFGVEFLYTETFDEDETDTVQGTLKFDTQAWGLLGTYRFGDEYYALVKGGYMFVDLRSKITGIPSVKFDEEGLSAGIGLGFKVGKSGTVELNYLLLPEISVRVGNEDFDIENELISLGYNWNF